VIIQIRTAVEKYSFAPDNLFVLPQVTCTSTVGTAKTLSASAIGTVSNAESETAPFN
jgi:hypothetical protein